MLKRVSNPDAVILPQNMERLSQFGRNPAELARENGGLTGADWNQLCDIVEGLERRFEVNDLVDRNIQIAANTITILREIRTAVNVLHTTAQEDRDYANIRIEGTSEQLGKIDVLMTHAQHNADSLCKLRASVTDRPGRNGNRERQNGNHLQPAGTGA